MTDFLIVANVVDSCGWIDEWEKDGVIDPRCIIIKAPTEEIIEYCLEAMDEITARRWFEQVADIIGWDYQILDVEEA